MRTISVRSGLGGVVANPPQANEEYRPGRDEAERNTYLPHGLDTRQHLERRVLFEYRVENLERAPQQQGGVWIRIGVSRLDRRVDRPSEMRHEVTPAGIS